VKGGGAIPPFPFSPFPIFLSSLRLSASPPLPLRSRAPQTMQLGGLGERCKLPGGVRGGASAENEFGALISYHKATGDNNFEYSEYIALQ